MKIANLVFAAFATHAVMAHYESTGDYIVNTEGTEPSLGEVWGDAWPFQGINTFAHLKHETCLTDRNLTFDIALIGVPFDTATSYRSGARFGPRAIRAASQRQTSLRSYNPRANFSPYMSWATIVDCGDIPVTPMDNSLAFKQMTMAFEELILEHKSSNNSRNAPRYVALGGDHSVILPHLRALYKVYGPINVIHFDAHLDTWKPDKYPSFWSSPQNELNHGSMLWKAHEEGILGDHNVHAGIRTKLSSEQDLIDDDEQHWLRISADDIWIKGVQNVIDTINKAVPKNKPTYISVDIDVLDPGFGSGTGTQEPGGWLPRELLYVLRGIDHLTLVGADVVEVNPDFDHAEITSTNGAQVAYELITSMAKKGPIKLNQVSPFEKMEVVEAEPRVRKDASKEDLLVRAKELQIRLTDLEKLKSDLKKELFDLRNMQNVI